MTIVINQPYFLPYIGLFDKIQKADLFVCNDWAPISICRDSHRRVKVALDLKDDSTRFLTELVESKDDGKLFSDILLGEPFYKRMGEIVNAIIHTYGKTPGCDYLIADLFLRVQVWAQTLGEYNYGLILLLMEKLGIKTPTVLLSQTNKVNKEELLKNPEGYKNHGTYGAILISKAFGATSYISGHHGSEFLDDDVFKNAKIKIIQHKFNQAYPHSDLSVIDLLFKHGEKAKEFLGKCSEFYEK